MLALTGANVMGVNPASPTSSLIPQATVSGPRSASRRSSKATTVAALEAAYSLPSAPVSPAAAE